MYEAAAIGSESGLRGKDQVWDRPARVFGRQWMAFKAVRLDELTWGVSVAREEVWMYLIKMLTQETRTCPMPRKEVAQSLSRKLTGWRSGRDLLSENETPYTAAFPLGSRRWHSVEEVDRGHDSPPKRTEFTYFEWQKVFTCSML